MEPSIKSIASDKSTRLVQSPLLDFLRFAIRTTTLLNDFHGRRPLHGCVNPASFSIHGENWKDSQPVLAESPQGPQHLAYISPEQTGRMNRTIDYRSDYYSLGVLLYQCVTGQLPFEANDALQLVYSHIAREPVPPVALDPSIPDPISNIILKLLAKNAEERYQSLGGLLADLEHCKEEFACFETIEPFILGQYDISNRLRIPQKLYGRESEIEQLVGVLDHIDNRESAFVLVTGYSGIGKSSLVNEIHKPVVSKGGYFISGKFDQFKRNIPCYAITYAFRELVRHILAGSEEHINNVRTKLIKALGGNGQIILDAIPELEHIIGKQPKVPVLGPAESQSRLNSVIQSFVSVFSQPEHPLVIFLDDLQWADFASLKLVQFLMTKLDKPCLLIICAYRDNEVDNADPVMMMVQEIEKQAKVETINVNALSQSSIVELVADTVKTDIQTAAPLGELVYRKTMGNPFFVGQFLKSLYSDGLITQRCGQWAWDINQIDTLESTDNVVDLLTKELSRLPLPTQRLLMFAACIGNRFDLQSLAAIAEGTRSQIRSGLDPAIDAGLVVPSSYDPSNLQRVGTYYRFLHDRVQQVAYAGIPEHDRKPLHLKIGRFLLATIPKKKREERIFDIVYQMNESIDLLKTKDKRLQLAELNLIAAQKASNSKAFDVGLKYVEIAKAMLGDEPWETNRKLAWPIFTKHALTLHGLAKYELAGEAAKLLQARAQSTEELAEANTLLFYVYFSQNQFVNAITIGLSGLCQLGVHLPKMNAINKDEIRRWRSKAHRALAGRTPKELEQLPRMTDQAKQAASNVLASLFTATTIAAPLLTPLVIYALLWLTARFGLNPSSSLAFSGYGFLLSLSGKETRTSYKFGELALNIQPYTSPVMKVAVAYLVHVIIKPQQELLRDAIAPVCQASQLAVSTEDLLWSPAGLISHANGMAVSGLRIPEVYALMESAIRLSQKLKLCSVTALGLPRLYLMASLSGNAIDKTLLAEGFDLSEFIAQQREFGNLRGLFSLYLYPAIGSYLFGRYQESLHHFETAELYADAVAGTIMIKEGIYFGCLTRLALISADDLRQHVRLIAMIDEIRIWARHTPMNYLHKWHLIEAERCRVLGKNGKAAEYYDRSIKGAHENKYLNDEAVANELAGKFYLGIGKQTIACAYLEQAHARYEEWGAFAKVRQLEQTYPHLLSRLLEYKQAREAAQTVSIAAQRIDIDTVIKASQILSSEIQLNRLLEKLMRLVAGNAGAQKGVLLLQRNGELQVQARVEGETVDVLDKAMTTDNDLNLGVINYVRRTRENIVLADAASDRQYNSEPYIQRLQPRSVLCLPLQKQNQLVGVLYLENNLATGAFTPERTKLLQLLSTQIAISLENAELYAELEHKVEMRTLALSEKNTELNDALRKLQKVQEQLLDLVNQLTEQKEISESANLAKSRFLAAASHDLQQPMHALNLYLELMDSTELPETIRPLFTSVRQCARNMYDMLSALLDISHLDTCVIQPEAAIFPVASLLENIRTEFTQQAIAKGLDLRIVDCSALVHSDIALVGRILRNLVSNAVRYTRHGKVLVGCRHVGSMLRLMVCDTGPGIALDQQRAIFEEFYQVAPAERDHAQGTGLGLAIVKRLARLLKTDVTLISKPGHGSLFAIDLPRASKHNAA